jgi:hypothetical protein
MEQSEIALRIETTALPRGTIRSTACFLIFG